jgi:uncharacterized protein
LSKIRYLPDVNVLLALTIRSHEFYSVATKWFESRGSSEFLLCPLTEAGFLRLSTEPRVGNKQLRDAIFLLREFSTIPGFRYRPIPDSWLNLTAPFTRTRSWLRSTPAFSHGLRQITINTSSLCQSLPEASVQTLRRGTGDRLGPGPRKPLRCAALT